MNFGRHRGGLAANVDVVLDRHGDAVQRATVIPGSDVGFSLVCFVERLLIAEADVGVSDFVRFVRVVEQRLGQLHRGDLFAFDQWRDVGDGFAE